MLYFTLEVENNEIVHSNFASKVLNEVNLLVKTYKDKADGSYFITANKYDKASQALERLELNLIQAISLSKRIIWF
ncbi:hypothetical protein NWQ33_07395 [Mycoplasmopsis cynos]|nr:hypothetical protein [Mycoplasmopsis cynos]